MTAAQFRGLGQNMRSVMADFIEQVSSAAQSVAALHCHPDVAERLLGQCAQPEQPSYAWPGRSTVAAYAGIDVVRRDDFEPGQWMIVDHGGVVMTSGSTVSEPEAFDRFRRLAREGEVAADGGPTWSPTPRGIVSAAHQPPEVGSGTSPWPSWEDLRSELAAVVGGERVEAARRDLAERLNGGRRSFDEVLADIDTATEEWEYGDAARWTPALLDDDACPADPWPSAGGWRFYEPGSAMSLPSPWVSTTDPALHVHYPPETAPERASRIIENAQIHYLGIGGVNLSRYVVNPPVLSEGHSFELTLAQQAWIDSLPRGQITVSWQSACPSAAFNCHYHTDIGGTLMRAVRAASAVLRHERAVKRVRLRQMHTSYRARKRGWR